MASLGDLLRFRYSLRFLLVAITVLGFALAWAARRAERNRIQRQHVERIWRLGGHVGFTEEKYMVRPVLPAEWDEELNQTWFEDALTTRTPTHVLFANRIGYPSNVTDDDVEELIAALKQLPTLRSVHLDATKLTPAGVAKVKSAFPFCVVRKGLDP